MINHALFYASKGWPVLPVHTIRNGHCTCGRNNCRSAGKHPMIEHGLTDASLDTEKIREWWGQWPDANIGVLTGELSGIICMDIDDLDAGGLNGHKIPDTVWQTTGSGGRHYLFQHPGESVKTTTKVLPGIDSRGDGGYILVPPSAHISGGVYRWENDPAFMDLAPAPDFWLEKVCGEGSKNERVIVPATENIAEGGRNNYLTQKAGTFRRSGMDAVEIEIALQSLNRSKCNPPLDADEVSIIARSVSRYDILTPEERELERIGDETLKQWEASEQAQIAEMLKNRPKTSRAGPPPECFVPPDGTIIRAGVDWILQTSIRPQPLLAVAAMTTFVGVCAGQRYATETDLRTNMYMVALAESGTGKDHARKCIKKLAEATKAKNLIGGDNIASGAAMISALVENPRRIYLLDEFGLMLQSINGKNAGGFQREIMKNFMELYSTANSTYHGTEYADRKLRKQEKIVEPCCCLYATSTHHTFYDALTGGDAASGAIARMIIVNDGEERGKRQRPSGFDIPQELIQMIDLIIESGSSGDLDDAPGDGSKQCNTRIVEMVSEVFDAYEDFDDSLTAHMTTPAAKSVYSRTAENAAKLALIYAISKDPVTPWIDHEAWIWGREVALWCANYLMEQVHTHIADNDFGRLCNRVCEFVRTGKADGRTGRDILRKFTMRKQDRDDVIQILVEKGDIVFNNDGKHVHIDYL